MSQGGSSEKKGNVFLTVAKGVEGE